MNLNFYCNESALVVVEESELGRTVSFFLSGRPCCCFSPDSLCSSNSRSFSCSLSPLNDMYSEKNEISVAIIENAIVHFISLLCKMLIDSDDLFVRIDVLIDSTVSCFSSSLSVRYFVQEPCRLTSIPNAVRI